jgi:hypothetical protein
MESGLRELDGASYFCRCEAKTTYDVNGRSGQIKLTWLEGEERKSECFKKRIWWEEGEKN